MVVADHLQLTYDIRAAARSAAALAALLAGVGGLGGETWRM